MLMQRAAPLVVISLLTVGGCLRHAASAPVASSRDEACSMAQTLNGVALDSFAVGPAEIAMPTGWVNDPGDWEELRLTRLGGQLRVWTGSPWVWPGRILPPSTTCIVTRGDTTIRIEARFYGRTYTVDVEWELVPDEDYLYMHWRTPHVQHLRQVRAIVDRVRFPTDRLRAARGAGGAAAMPR